MLFQRMTAFLATLTLALAALAPAVAAASFELSATAKSNLAKLIAGADKTQASRLTKLNGELQSLQNQDQSLDAKIRAVHYRNEEDLVVLRKQIKEIDAEKVNKLQQQVKQAKSRYQPLFDSYAALNKQIAAARRLNNKTLNALLRTQADAMKIAVQAARQDIRNKEQALKNAKDQAAKKKKKMNDTLAGFNPVQVQLKAQRSKVASTKKLVASAIKNANQATKGTAKNAADSLSSLVAVSRQLVEQKQRNADLEQKASDIIAKARTQLKAI